MKKFAIAVLATAMLFGCGLDQKDRSTWGVQVDLSESTQAEFDIMFADVGLPVGARMHSAFNYFNETSNDESGIDTCTIYFVEETAWVSDEEFATALGHHLFWHCQAPADGHVEPPYAY